MRTRNVKEFGATGDGTTLDTVAIQTAIDAGGLVYFPPGVYLSGTLYLRSNGGLELSPGAILRGSPNLADYNPADFVPQNSASKAEVTSGGHLIAAVECSNIVLCGGGTIDGNHPAFLNETDPECPLMYRRIARPGQMVFLCECTDVRIQDLNLKNAPYWTCFLHGCEEVTIHGLHIQSDPRVLNDDGIDLDCCRRVTVSDCIISTGDDALTLRGNNSRLKQKRDCCEIVVTNCILESHYANAIRVGVGCGEIHDALFENIIVPGYRTAISLVSNWSNDPASCVGAEIHDIEFRNIRSHARRFLQIKLDNAPEGNAHTSATLHGIMIQHVRGTMELSNMLRGNGVGKLYDITLDDIRLNCRGNGPAPEQDFKGAWGHASTDAAFELNHADEIEFRNVRIDYAPEACGWHADIRATHSTFHTTMCKFSLGFQPESTR